MAIIIINIILILLILAYYLLQHRCESVKRKFYSHNVHPPNQNTKLTDHTIELTTSESPDSRLAQEMAIQKPPETKPCIMIDIPF